jgi:hypothetical protein
MLCLQSLVKPAELFHSHELMIYSGLGCVGVLTRESDIFVSRALVPYPVLALLVFVPPLIGRFQLRRARNLHLCEDCGYDLRATPERCPECGKVPTRRGSAAT